MEHGAKRQGRTVCALGSDLAVAQAPTAHLNATTPGCKASPPAWPGPDGADRPSGADLTFRNTTQLADCRQQIPTAIAQMGGSRLAWSEREADQPLQNTQP